MTREENAEAFSRRKLKALAVAGMGGLLSGDTTPDPSYDYEYSKREGAENNNEDIGWAGKKTSH